MHKNRGPVQYGDYLELNELLTTQKPLSKKYGSECHDETLFIIVHQVYELWFKQIIHEFKSIVDIFKQSHVPEKSLTIAIERLERIKKIQPILIEQLGIMETMTPMDFLEFRELLIPASGFQSVQFRKIEVMMGLSTKKRTEVDRDYFLGRLKQKEKEEVLKLEEEPSLFELLETWLERMPFTQKDNFNFWNEYQASVQEMMNADELIIKNNLATLSPKEQEAQLANIELTRLTFNSLLDREKHDELLKDGKRRLSQKAILNGLFILLFRDEPILQQPYRLLKTLMDIDENFTAWRYSHALMAHRMLGTKIGTGGSSGHHYLKVAADNNRVYTDLFNLSTYIIPRSCLPAIPENIQKELDFFYGEK